MNSVALDGGLLTEVADRVVTDDFIVFKLLLLNVLTEHLTEFRHLWFSQVSSLTEVNML